VAAETEAADEQPPHKSKEETSPEDEDEDSKKQQQPPVYINALSTHAQMYALGDKYAIPALSSDAATKFSISVGNASIAGPFPQWLVSEMLKAVPDIYTSTPETDRELRDKVATLALRHWDILDSHPDFEGTISACPAFMRDVANRWRRERLLLDAGTPEVRSQVGVFTQLWPSPTAMKRRRP